MSEENDAELQLLHCNKIVDALNSLAAGLKPCVEQQLQQRYRNAWQDNISHARSGHASNLADPYVLLATIDDHWNTFDTVFKATRSVVKELRKDRNDAIHHDEPFSLERVNNSISSMLRLLKSIPPSQKSIKMVEKLEKLKYQRSFHTDEQESALDDRKSEIQNSEAQQNTPLTKIDVASGEPNIATDAGQLDDHMSINNSRKNRFVQPNPAPSSHALPSVTYDYNRLCFKRKYIEPLADNEAFRVVTPSGTFQMTKAEFYSAFPKVIISKSYTESGIYHYPSVPRSALPYKLPE